MGNFVKEFKEFAVKGNAIDMAVGVIIGGAFGSIVNSIVNDIIMPPIGWLIGGVNFSDLKVELPQVVIQGVEMAPATINYGNFIQTIINFFIIAFCVFMMVKGITKMKNLKAKEEAEAEAEAPAAPAEPSAEEKLLREIRDLLAKK
jgi:large conductance mechanosensitive channel